MSRTKYRVTPTGDGDWKVKRDGASRADSIHQNKSDALDRARDLATNNKPGQVVIYRRDGKIQTEHTYGKDPYPPKG
jgi:hypothetical protein